ncbi:DEAD/DEAH box helicase domain-containing protein [Besnoitia besnoiti]|uniref:RNA helicase n=1 Tax=Besnoitia besnoiti TaxID=94643 RepID=A0A2A9MMM1_BESBE|nr:DEAD/DEAH box helicase domain-containing protein [Besnoitia besnoiti]PFH37691.1 DEAD/DEAH box helicase domain-containing protein [Besnoitia besnoiti]
MGGSLQQKEKEVPAQRGKMREETKPEAPAGDKREKEAAKKHRKQSKSDKSDRKSSHKRKETKEREIRYPEAAPEGEAAPKGSKIGERSSREADKDGKKRKEDKKSQKSEKAEKERSPKWRKEAKDASKEHRKAKRKDESREEKPKDSKRERRRERKWKERKARSRSPQSAASNASGVSRPSSAPTRDSSQATELQRRGRDWLRRSDGVMEECDSAEGTENGRKTRGGGDSGAEGEQDGRESRRGSSGDRRPGSGERRCEAQHGEESDAGQGKAGKRSRRDDSSRRRDRKRKENRRSRKSRSMESHRDGDKDAKRKSRHGHRRRHREDKDRDKKRRRNASSRERSASLSSSASHRHDRSKRRRRNDRDKKRRRRDRRRRSRCSSSSSSRSSSSLSDLLNLSAEVTAKENEPLIATPENPLFPFAAAPPPPVPGEKPKDAYPASSFFVNFSYLSLLPTSLPKTAEGEGNPGQFAAAPAAPVAATLNTNLPTAPRLYNTAAGEIPPPPPTPPPPTTVAAAQQRASNAAASATGLSLDERLAALQKTMAEENSRRAEQEQRQLQAAVEGRGEKPLIMDVMNGRDPPEGAATEEAAAAAEAPAEKKTESETYNAEERIGEAFAQLEDQEVTVTIAGPDAGLEDPKRLPLPIAEVLDCEKVLNSAIMSNLLRLGYKRLLPVQRHAIPIASAGRDICGSAATGCGKTMAFLAPLTSNLLNLGEVIRPFFPGPRAQASPTGLVLAPTRELALQIGEEVGRLCRDTPLRHILLIGGVPQFEQTDKINEYQIDIAVCTPGRLIDLCDACKISLHYVQILVLDEADAMLSLGFRPLIKSIVRERDMPKDRQTFLFSATYPPELTEMLPMVLKSSYVQLSVGSAAEHALPGGNPPSARNSLVKQIVKMVDEPLKAMTLRADLEAFLSRNEGQAIVFVRSKRALYPTQHTIQLAGIHTETLSGSLVQPDRAQVFRDFRSGKFPVLVTTSVAARGLDFPNVGLVINVDMPIEMEHYVHRIGRTGRAGRRGIAISYMNWNDKRLAPAMIQILKQHEQDVPSFLHDMANTY